MKKNKKYLVAIVVVLLVMIFSSCGGPVLTKAALSNDKGKYLDWGARGMMPNAALIKIDASYMLSDGQKIRILKNSQVIFDKNSQPLSFFLNNGNMVKMNGVSFELKAAGKKSRNWGDVILNGENKLLKAYLKKPVKVTIGNFNFTIPESVKEQYGRLIEDIVFWENGAINKCFAVDGTEAFGVKLKSPTRLVFTREGKLERIFSYNEVDLYGEKILPKTPIIMGKDNKLYVEGR